MILRPGKTPSGAEVRAHLRRLVRHIRKSWPKTRILFRGDGHYARPEAMAWCEDHGVDYVFGLPGTKPLSKKVDETADAVRVERALALGMMLALAKKIAQSDKIMRRGGNLDRFAMAATDLERKTVGIVGIGNIGSCTAALCGGLMGMSVLAYDPYLTAEQIAARGAQKVELDDLLARSDFVSLHCPREAETLGMFGLEQFSKMKRSAYFINTARGGIHNEDELVTALGRGLIAGAGLDVFLTEPAQPDHPLLAFETVVASPHIAGVTDGAMYNMARAAAEQWITILAGEVPPRLVNPEAWPSYGTRFERVMGFAPKPLAD